MKAADELEELLARKRRLESPSSQAADFVARRHELRIWQAARLARTYRDFRADPRYAPALEFFLSDLYSAHEFTERDRQLSRAWRYLKRALPAAVMKVLRQAIELDVLTLELDQAMVRALAATPVTDAAYAAAYREVGERALRERQIELIVGIGADLRRIASRAWLWPLLRAAHAPAHAAGFGVLQDFLERGYTAFLQMHASDRLLQAIQERETHFMLAMLDPNDSPLGAAGEHAHE